MINPKSPFRLEALRARATGEVGEPRGYMSNGLYVFAALLTGLLALLIVMAVTRSITISGDADCRQLEARGADKVVTGCSRKVIQPVKDVLGPSAAERVAR